MLEAHSQVIAAISMHVKAFQKASCKHPNTAIQGSMVWSWRPPPMQDRWQIPCSSYVKIDVDASWVVATHVGFIGVIVRDLMGSFIAARRSRFQAPSVPVAEALAILRGCELGHSLGLSHAVVESDSSNSISCLQGSFTNGRWEAFPILTRCKKVDNFFHDCRWSWAPRSANMAADRLASRSCVKMCDFTWVDRPPSSLVHVLNKDGLPCPH
ncbi:hypothetical protein TB2_047250 [Malus domestica]